MGLFDGHFDAAAGHLNDVLGRRAVFFPRGGGHREVCVMWEVTSEIEEAEYNEQRVQTLTVTDHYNQPDAITHGGKMPGHGDEIEIAGERYAFFRLVSQSPQIVVFEFTRSRLQGVGVSQ